MRLRSWVIVTSIATALALLAGGADAASAQQSQAKDAWPLRDLGFVKVRAPTDWHVKEEQSGDGRAVFVTKESIEAAGSVRTSLSVNGIRDIPAKARMAPTQLALSFSSATSSRNSLARPLE